MQPVVDSGNTERRSLRVVDMPGNDLPASAMPSSSHHPRNYTADLPVTGAWRSGDPARGRHFVVITDDRPFVLEAGGSLAEVTMAYETWGELNEDASNAVLVCHALTGDAHAGPGLHPSDPEGWWEDLVGPGKAIDSNTHYVVCVNVLGGCQGSTGPASIEPATGRSYGSSFPAVTIRDIVRAQAKVSDRLGVEQWKSVIGGSMGGMQALEWAVMFPERVRSIAPIATSLAASAQQIAWSAVGRTALALDPKWRGGDYYEAEPGDGPHAGLAIARAIAQIHYRSDPSFQGRFGRSLVDPDELLGLWDRFQVESYLDYHGEKLVRRFDANSYLRLTRSMDTHDLSRGRVSLEAAVARIAVPVVTASISTDFLYPPHQQAEICELVSATGVECVYEVIDNLHGHDGFLLAADELGGILADLLAREDI